MEDPYQAGYWDEVAADRQFSHPLDREFLDREVPRAAAILDVGCGYGRTLIELHSLGYTSLTGVDTSRAMIERGRAEHPQLDLRVVEGERLPFADESFDLVLLFAVLTSIPDLDCQDRLLEEVQRVLAPGGHVQVSDLRIQSDARNRARYDRDRDVLGYGAFRTEDGGVFRHHDQAWLERLSARWSRSRVRELEIVTMNGHPARGFQLTGRKP